MNLRAHALFAVVVCVVVMSACSTSPRRPCSISYYYPVRDFGYCEMGPNLAREALERGW